MLEVINLTSYKIDKKFLGKVAQRTLKIAGNKKIKEVSLVLASERKIKEINRKYRKKNKPTNVLSFEELNEIFICPQVVQKEAKKQKKPFETELTRMLIHGILHLSGYDHEESKKEAAKMQKLEDKILNILNLFYA